MEIPKLTCLRCGNSWPPRVEAPKRCPACKSPSWNIPSKIPEAQA